LAGENDAGLSVEGGRKSAAHYQADFIVAPGAAHNVMMEHNYRQIAERVHNWLTGVLIENG
jgi:hypothetical protein